MQLKVLYADATMAEVMPQVLKSIHAITQGEMPYSENVMSALLLKLSSLLAGPNYVPPLKLPRSVDEPQAQDDQGFSGSSRVCT